MNHEPEKNTNDQVLPLTMSATVMETPGQYLILWKLPLPGSFEEYCSYYPSHYDDASVRHSYTPD